MIVRHAVIGSAMGLHARTAARLAQAVKNTKIHVEISDEQGGNAEADSMLDVMSLDIEHGQTVKILTDADEHPDANIEEITQKMDALAALLETDLDAEDEDEI